MNTRMASLGLVLALGTGAWTCPGIETEAPTEVCQRVGEKCKLQKGPLGVCDRITPCPDRKAKDDCLQCMPQH